MQLNVMCITASVTLEYVPAIQVGGSKEIYVILVVQRCWKGVSFWFDSSQIATHLVSSD